MIAVEYTSTRELPDTEVLVDLGPIFTVHQELFYGSANWMNLGPILLFQWTFLDSICRVPLDSDVDSELRFCHQPLHISDCNINS